MANLNKVMLIGRLTRDPEVRTFANGGKVAKIGFAVNNRKKNQQTGQWEDVPVFLDVEAFNRGEFGKLADSCEQYLRKGRQIFIEGHLRMDQWETDGQKRSKIVVVVDNFQFLEPRQDGEGGGTAPRMSGPGSTRKSASSNYSGPSFDDRDSEPPMEAPEGPNDDIPF
jgi:single-strand DNA-binding protein